MQQNPSFVLVLVFQILVLLSGYDCRLLRKEGYKRLKRAPDFGIVYNSFTACGAAFINQRWLMSGYNCMYIRMGMREKKRVRNTIKPYIRAKVKDVNTCGDQCGVVVVKTDRILLPEPDLLSFSLMGFKDMICTQPKLMCATVKKPISEHSVVQVYQKMPKPIEDTSKCWLEDNYYYKNKYLCAEIGPVSGPPEDITICNKTNDKWSDTELFLDGPYMCYKHVYGFFNWKSCDSRGRIGFGNLSRFKDYLVKATQYSPNRRSDDDKEGGDAKKPSEDVPKPIPDEPIKPSEEEDAQMNQEETESSGGSYHNVVRIWIVSTMAFLLCVQSV